MFHYILTILLFLLISLVLIINNDGINNYLNQYQAYRLTKFYSKYYSMYVMLLIRQKLNSRRSEKVPQQLDNLQVLSISPLAFDAVYFVINTSNGIIISAGCERRHDGIVYGLFYIWIPGIGLLYNREMPETKLATSENNQVFGSNEFYFKSIEPMKLWEIHFEGKMRLHNSDKFMFVRLKANWLSESVNCFKLDQDININALARAFADEQWSREYFKNLKSNNPVRYEQFGITSAELLIDNKKINIDHAASYRDHCFGDYRNWNTIHNYVYFIISLENGTNIILGVVSHPDTFSRLVIGCVYSSEQKYTTIKSTDIKIDFHKEKRCVIKKYRYNFVAGNEKYTVEMNAMEQHTHYKGFDNEAALTQKFAHFLVNNVPGYGVCEINYNRHIYGL